jgi:hypothetical protein
MSAPVGANKNVASVDTKYKNLIMIEQTWSLAPGFAVDEELIAANKAFQSNVTILTHKKAIVQCTGTYVNVTFCS